MLKPIRSLLVIIFIACTGFGPFSWLSHTNDAVGSGAWISEHTHGLTRAAPDLKPEVIAASLKAYAHASSLGQTHQPILTVVDYSLPSTQKRLWVINLDKDQVLYHTYVAHGKNSGENVSNHFSNDSRSLQSSIGVYRTDETYYGQHGYSMRVQGLEPGVNDNALKRNIVFHGASYVSEEIAKQRNRLGRSWGCFALNEKELTPIVKTIKDHTIVVAYYPDKNWLAHSNYLQI